METLALALLYRIQVRYLTKKKVEITLIPTWLGRKLWRRLRVGVATRYRDDKDEVCWWWTATTRHVGDYIERYIEAAPVLLIEDMPIEMLLQEGNGDT